ncbi:hypothetical protein H6G81_11055 [Scytonema hofmannii FACHB-248]|uniref:Uncharacterized protein n=1 Tax=Scytonema hofmannii FACHB-248 TaxID=1842502 RepID=A0ABR8GPD5_9CYAN|nr:hypothetical protein [Scytonema hofmannii]MBD2605054.1 hypothetical protein [Scytonema hofmannii FACHB-248]
MPGRNSTNVPIGIICKGKAVSIFTGLAAIAEITIEFAEITIEFAEITIEFAEITIEFAEITFEFAEITIEFAEAGLSTPK